MGLFPLDGAVHDTAAEALPAPAFTPVGAAGTVEAVPARTTSSTYIDVSSGGLAPSPCTLNHNTTV